MALPNILLIIADDFGVHQLGCTLGQAQGGNFFSTPQLDRLAAEGVRFARAYATAPVCTPARASLYTGIHPARLHLTDFIPGSQVINAPLLSPDWQRGLPVAAVTLGDVFKARGYSTAHFGKWHLAADYNYVPGRPMDPESQGFDEVVVTRKPPPDADPETDPHHIGTLTDRVIEFCCRSRAQPFFCVLAHNAVHRPELAPAGLVRKYAGKPGADEEINRPVLGAMIEQMDSAVGRLMAALRQSGADRSTLVIFTADHGPLGPSAVRKPLRGAKADLYEGGVRVPLLMRWPDRIRPGQVRDPLVSGADLFPTLLAAAGVEPPGPVDGISLWPWINESSPPPSRSELCWHYPHYHHLGLGPSGAIRAGDYKLVEWFERSLRPRSRPHPHDDESPYELFNVAADPGETQNLADVQPERCAALRRRLEEWRVEVGAQPMIVNPAYDPSAATQLLPPPGDSAFVPPHVKNQLERP
jgi:arylsulfatase A-like enzyme